MRIVIEEACFCLLALEYSHQLSSLFWSSDYMIVSSRPAAVGVTGIVAPDGQSHVKHAKSDYPNPQHITCQPHIVANRQ